MNYSVLRDVISGPWQVEPMALNTLIPIYKGLIAGTVIEQQVEPIENTPYVVSAESRETVHGGSVENNQPNNPIIHVMPIRGIMTKHDQTCGPVGTRTLAARLLAADEDPDVIGHIQIVESPGGQVSAVPELTSIYASLKKPVVTFVDGQCGSAAYYNAVHTSYIIASRESDSIGCIGTMLQAQGRKSKSEANADGVVSVVIMADGSEDKNADFIEAIDNFNFLPIKENVLNPLNAQFKDAVKSNRPNATEEQLKGRTFFASDVVGTLIDEIGPFSLAVEKVIELADYKPAQKTNTSSQKSNIKNMNNFQLLLAAMVAAGVATQEMELDADGALTLNQEQLQAIEDVLASNNTEELTQQLNESTQTLETANQTIAERDGTITALNSQIENLKSGAGADTLEVAADAAGTAKNEDLGQEDVDLYNQIAN